MKKFLLSILIICVLAVPSFAETTHVRKVSESARTASGVIAIPIPLTTTVYTKSFPIKSATSEVNIGVTYAMTPATGDTAIFFQQSTEKPATEGSADVNYLTTYVIDTSIVDSQLKMTTIDTVELIYGRFKLVGQGTNPATSVLNIKFVK